MARAQKKSPGRVTTRASRRSGEGGIRTLGALASTLVFETSTIGHSVTSPTPIS
jgi:hypothetical protein